MRAGRWWWGIVATVATVAHATDTCTDACNTHITMGTCNADAACTHHDTLYVCMDHGCMQYNNATDCPISTCVWDTTGSVGVCRLPCAENAGSEASCLAASCVHASSGGGTPSPPTPVSYTHLTLPTTEYV